VLLTEHTARLVEGFFALADLGPRAMKGVSARSGSSSSGRSAPSARGSTRRAPGPLPPDRREAELAWLESILSRSIESNGQVVGVVGDAGVGKSRLCLEFSQRCRARGVAVYEVHCPAHGATVPWLAIRELLQSYLALDQVRRGGANSA
jgi:adenylate cyclase